jgi:predicted acylesterase/phospholipase RssA
VLTKDIDAFARALEDDHNATHITSQNDWAPVNYELPKRKRRRKSKVYEDEFGLGLGHMLFRWPILILVGLWIVFLVISYACVRLYVAYYEYLITWRGKRRKLRQKLRSATSYQEWIQAAQALDDYLDYSEWKLREKSSYYDYKTVTKIVKQLRHLNEKIKNVQPNGAIATQCNEKNPDKSHSIATKEWSPGGGKESDGRQMAAVNEINDLETLATVLESCVKFNFAGTQGRELYSQCYYGTKDIVDKFNKELVNSLDVLGDSNLPSETKRIMFRLMSKNLGKSALCLSGGACFTYRHFGVVKALLQAGLLPNIISGTSGGGLVAALVCTRTNSELEQLLVPQLADKITACWEKFPEWVKRWYRTGARFDAVDWAERCCWFTMGSLTFVEAFERTGRVLNISTIPADPHSPVILCNYITSPNTVIWSALLASAAVPGILNPVVLMMKNKKGDVVPFSFGNKWKDGSLRTDVPINALNAYFGVNFSIVSQVNPHISLFVYAPRGTIGRPVSHRRGKGWRGGFVGSALETIVKLELRKWLNYLKNMKLIPRLKDQDWSYIWLQRFEGTVTVWPKIKVVDFWHILDDPTREKMADMILLGERSMYPKLLFIQHFINIERAIQRGRKKCSRKSYRAILKEDDAYHSTDQGAALEGDQEEDETDSSEE